jgi:hypothetical protein
LLKRAVRAVFNELVRTRVVCNLSTQWVG